MGEAAIAAARAAGYTNAGTVEFLVDKNKDFYFLEMNTRVQVEHTISEEITGIDIVKEMIRIAAGERLSFTQDEIVISGSAIECRINAEDPRNNFLPTTGRITAYYSPGGFGVRIDGNVYRGYVVPPHYDSMLAKMTVWGRTWEEAVSRTARSLDEFVVRGVKTTIPFYRMILRDEMFRKGEFDTHYIENRFNNLKYEDNTERIDLVFAIAAAITSHSYR
jgi:pyruvate carboxylase subunit A